MENKQKNAINTPKKYNTKQISFANAKLEENEKFSFISEQRTCLSQTPVKRKQCVSPLNCFKKDISGTSQKECKIIKSF